MKFSQEFALLNPSKHLIKDFNCAKKTMNDFLVRFAAKHAKQGLSTTMVLAVDNDSLKKIPIVAYYTLAISTVSRNEIHLLGYHHIQFQ